MFSFLLFVFSALVVTCRSQSSYNNTNFRNSILREANGTLGPAVEEVHYFYNQLPIGLAVSSTGRIFTCYTRGTYNYTLGVVVNKTAEGPFPTSGPVQNLPASQINTTFNGIDFGPANQTGLISVQALIISSATASRPETLWVVDTGRPTIMNSDGDPSMVYGQPGGPKIIGINITAIDSNATSFNDTVYTTYTFPANVHYPDSYMNDMRVDLRNISGTGGSGIAYIVDSSDEGRPGFIMLDLATGESWRRLSEDPSVLRTPNNVPSYVSQPFYYEAKGMPIGWLQEGLDGIQLSPDGSRVYYSPLTSTELFSIPSVNLRARNTDPLAELAAHGNISHHGQRGGPANGFEGDSEGRIYQLMPTQDAVYYYDPRDLQTHTFVADPRILWPDSANVAEDGYFYMTVTQLFYQPNWNNGTDGRRKPGTILRAKLPGNATKIRSS